MEDKIYEIIYQSSEEGTVADICAVSKEKINPGDSPNKEYTYLGLEHIESNTGEIIEKNKELGLNILSTKNKFEKGDVLYGKLRPVFK